jgi:hypothetical protein
MWWLLCVFVLILLVCIVFQASQKNQVTQLQIRKTSRLQKRLIILFLLHNAAIRLLAVQVVASVLLEGLVFPPLIIYTLKKWCENLSNIPSSVHCAQKGASSEYVCDTDGTPYSNFRSHEMATRVVVWDYPPSSICYFEYPCGHSSTIVPHL